MSTQWTEGHFIPFTSILRFETKEDDRLCCSSVELFVHVYEELEVKGDI